MEPEHSLFRRSIVFAFVALVIAVFNISSLAKLLELKLDFSGKGSAVKRVLTFFVFQEMPPRKKRTCLSFREKVEVLEALEKGKSGVSLSQKYGVDASVISCMKRQKDAILSHARKLEEAGCSDRKMLRTSKFEEMEEALYVWFLQNRTAGNPVSGPLLCEKALFFNARLANDKHFKASQGWLEKFKKRHGIRCHMLYGEKLSADDASAESFREEFKKLLEEEEDYDPDFVYNADETGLNWKALPAQSLIASNEENAPGYKSRKERVTVMLCANSTGSHRLPLYLIGKAKNPRSFRGVKNLPVAYGHQKKAWMNVHLFRDWMKKEFIPEVK